LLDNVFQAVGGSWFKCWVWAYTLCVMERLQDRLRRRDVYVEAAERWSDPRAKLLQGTGVSHLLHTR